MTRFKYSHSSKIIQDQYLGFSFFASLFIWMGAWVLDSNPFHQNFFLTGLMLGNLYFYYFGYGLVGASRLFVFPVYYLFQTLTLVGASFEQSSIGPLYLCLIPCAAGLYHFISRDLSFNQDNFLKGASLGAISLLMFLTFNSITKSELISLKETVFVGGFVFWFSGVIFWGIRMAFKENRSLIHNVLKKQHAINLNDKESKDRYFFHDLINMTHGLNLFLGQKLSGGNSLDYNEVKSLRNEIKMIQSLIKDHFQLGHKNLFGTYEFVSFNFAKESIIKLVRSYLPEHLVETHFIFKGSISDTTSFEESEKSIIHFPSFYRIINNLVKNMAEDKTTEVEFVFDYTDKGLSVTAKSKVFKLGDNHENLAKDLSDIIMGTDQFSPDDKAFGLGLKSIANLCDEQQGEFSFNIEDGFWVNRVFLPKIKYEDIQEDYQIKKAA
ncbi:MAG: hypothetical protein KC493_10285 [Bacteriovoracaceae bacterium]|nr:hypothetical protein [Bacteriovoracaceae bacterium]